MINKKIVNLTEKWNDHIIFKSKLNFDTWNLKLRSKYAEAWQIKLHVTKLQKTKSMLKYITTTGGGLPPYVFQCMKHVGRHQWMRSIISLRQHNHWEYTTHHNNHWGHNIITSLCDVGSWTLRGEVSQRGYGRHMRICWAYQTSWVKEGRGQITKFT